MITLGYMKYIIWLIIGLGLGYASGVYAKTRPIVINSDTVKIIYEVSKEYDIDAQVLVKIAYTESKFKADAVRTNKNGTIDYGMFQINSVHWSTTCKSLDIMTVRGNASCAALIIKGISKHSDTDEHWLGRYHSKTPSRKVRYNNLLNQVPVINLAIRE
jgi:hypothetical protein